MSDTIAIQRIVYNASVRSLLTGDYITLFEIEGDRVIIYRIKHRSRAYS
jgi:hypothetical protein